MPRYLAGNQAMLEFIQQNIHYPELLNNRRIEGAVHVSFIVGKDGMIREVQAMSDCYSHNIKSGGHKKTEDEMRNDKIATAILNKEAIRVVSLLNGFSPGIMNGDLVCVQLSVPVVFKPEHWEK
jgi:protein TonB